MLSRFDANLSRFDKEVLEKSSVCVLVFVFDMCGFFLFSIQVKIRLDQLSHTIDRRSYNTQFSRDSIERVVLLSFRTNKLY